MSGYSESVSEVIGDGIFTSAARDMVCVRNIDMYSLCEHHMVPFFGKVHIAYVPTGRILGLSKLARVVSLFSRRLQVQERLTRDIALAVMHAVDAAGVGVTIEASLVSLFQHSCCFFFSSFSNSIFLFFFFFFFFFFIVLSCFSKHCVFFYSTSCFFSALNICISGICV